VWYARAHELIINEDKTVKELGSCHVDFPLPEGDKKGWEGAEYVDGGEAGEFLLGVCEGNYCEVRKSVQQSQAAPFAWAIS
jgi:hypothetical protein